MGLLSRASNRALAPVTRYSQGRSLNTSGQSCFNSGNSASLDLPVEGSEKSTPWIARLIAGGRYQAS